MNTKALYAAIAVIVILIAGFLLYNQYHKNDNTNTLSNDNTVSDLNNASDLTNDNSNITDNTNTSDNSNISNTNSDAHFSGESDIQGKVVEVDYDGSKFTPSTVTINAGDTVAFKNTGSSASVWPASDPHPTHTDYPGFDALKGIAPGGTYSFTFTKTGSWGYHNHLNPAQQGTIVVQ